jgi:hypothetical protein
VAYPTNKQTNKQKTDFFTPQLAYMPTAEAIMCIQKCSAEMPVSVSFWVCYSAMLSVGKIIDLQGLRKTRIMEHWYKDNYGKPKHSEKRRVCATFSARHPTWTDPRSNPYNSGDRPDTKHLILGTVFNIQFIASVLKTFKIFVSKQILHDFMVVF